MATQVSRNKQSDVKRGTKDTKAVAPQIQTNGQTAAPDETYGLVSVLYHALQGAQTYAQYLADAEKAGEEELTEFFQQCIEEENQRAARAKELLAIQLGAAPDEEDDEDDDDDDDDDEEEEEEEES
ncbi:MAG TPA: hypothetical protein VG937_01630 [Polyangiaceae bacterium]|jgi:hypothetical protein|nr:hypothetical protein [Polyangiaceae bacterium]